MASVFEAIEPAEHGQPNRCERCRRFQVDAEFPYAGRCLHWTWSAPHWIDVDREDTCGAYQPDYPPPFGIAARALRALEALLLVVTRHGRDPDDETERAEPPQLLAGNLTTGKWGERRARLLARLSRRLQGADETECLASLHEITGTGTHAAELRSVVEPLVRHASARIRVEALHALRVLGAAEGVESSVVIERLQDEDERVRLAALGLLEAAPSWDPAVMDALHQLASSATGHLATRLASLLLDLTPGDPRVIERLFELLATSDAIDAAELLAGRLGADPRVIAWVEAAVREWPHAPRARQLALLERIGQLAGVRNARLRANLAPIIAELPDADPELCIAMLDALPLDPTAIPLALPRVRALVTHPDAALASRALHGVGRIGSAAHALAADMAIALGRPEREVRRAAVEALQRFGPAALPALERVTQALRRSEGPAPDDLRWYELYGLAQILEAIGPAAASAVPVLLEWLTPAAAKLRYMASVPFHDFRGGVMAALGAIGLPAAAPAVPLILDLVDDDWNQYSAARALHALAPNDPDFRSRVLEAGLDWPPPR